MVLINSLQTDQSSLKPDYIWNEQDFLFHEMKLNTKIRHYYLLLLKKLSTNVQKNYYLYLTFYFFDSHVILKICQSLKLFNICLLFCKNLNGFGWHDIQFYHSVAVLTVTLGQCHQTSINGWNKPDACYRNVCQWKNSLENTSAILLLLRIQRHQAFFIKELPYYSVLYYSMHFSSQICHMTLCCTIHFSTLSPKLYNTTRQYKQMETNCDYGPVKSERPL